MDVEPDPYGCKFDSITIMVNEGKQTIQRFCGDEKPFPFIIKSPEAKIRFKTDDAEQRSGFALKYDFS